MFTSFLIKYAEIGIKGKNRYLFEDALVRQIKYALKKCEGEFLVHKTQGRRKSSAFPGSVRWCTYRMRASRSCVRQ